MSVLDLLKSFVDQPAAGADAHQVFDQVARQVPQDALAGGLSEAFRSDQTPEFGQMAANLFSGSNPQQQAGLLGQLARSLGPALLSSIAGGVLGRMNLGGGNSSGVAPATDVAPQVTPEQVHEIATAAEKHDPGVMDRIGAYYAQHPDVVKVLGGTALAVALGQIANRMKS